VALAAIISDEMTLVQACEHLTVTANQAASATFALKAGVWFRAVVLSSSLLIRWAQRARCQAETPLIVLCRFPGRLCGRDPPQSSPTGRHSIDFAALRLDADRRRGIVALRQEQQESGCSDDVRGVHGETLTAVRHSTTLSWQFAAKKKAVHA